MTWQPELAQMNPAKNVQWADPVATFTNLVCNPQDLLLNNEQTPPRTPPTQPLEVPPRFVLGQEVFILDRSGTDPTGLTTYLVLRNDEKDIAGQYLYRLMPSQEIVFRAAETRLLEVNFPMGAQVRRTNDAIGSVITRRYVEKGERLYDLRDEQGRSMKGVNEAELVLHNGGRFPFVVQMNP